MSTEAMNKIRADVVIKQKRVFFMPESSIVLWSKNEIR